MKHTEWDSFFHGVDQIERNAIVRFLFKEGEALRQEGAYAAAFALINAAHEIINEKHIDQ